MNPPRGDAGSRRAAILDAALPVFSQYGYRRTSMDDIAREAGIRSEERRVGKECRL